MDMNKVKLIFLKAAELEDEQGRSHFLSEACGDDEETRLYVERILTQDVSNFLSTPLAVERPKTPPPSVPDYELLHLIGRGGFGQVWLGRNQHTDEFCAVKLTAKSARTELSGVREYKKRAEDNPFLVPINHVGEADESYYYVMPLADDVKGSTTLRSPDQYEPLTLDRFLRQKGQLSIPAALEIVDQLLSGLERLHERGGIHCDVKPANIMRVNGSWMLGDAGLICHGNEAGMLRGTSGFRPPEGYDNPGGDLYALGKTLFVMLTAQDPSSVEDLENGTLTVPGSDTQADKIRELILRACHQDSTRRFSSSGEMRKTLGELSASGGEGAGRPVKWFAALLLLAVTVSVAATLWSPSEPVTILSMEVTQYRGAPEAFEIGTIGRESFTTYLDDAVTVSAKCSQPAYCYLFAYNPIDAAPPRWCIPGAANMAASESEAIEFPTNPGVYPLTHGTGLQVFVLVVSKSPLPAATNKSVASENGLWGKVAHDAVWRFEYQAGGKPSFVGRIDKDRGKIRTRAQAPQEFVNLCSFFQNLSGVDAVQAVAFPVKPLD